ncbi:MAG: sipS [Clostridiaceae bacterium]|jgi:signal peptidase I|nr:sipS [Clostridiaceae bacterium]
MNWFNNKIGKEIKEYSISIIIAFIIALTFKTYVFARADVVGPSMQNTLHTNDVVFAEKVSLLTHDFKKGQIVIFNSHDISNNSYVKRIIALEGDTVEIKNGKVYVNEKIIDEPYVSIDNITTGGSFLREGQKYTVPSNHIFVMGDNRENSTDSREIGAIDYKDIEGHVILRAYPFASIKYFKN